MSLTFLVLYGSVRTERQGIRAARYVREALAARGHAVQLVDPVETPFPFLDRMYKEYAAGAAPEVMQRVAALIAGADGFVIVSGEYNHGIPPVLKNLLDHYLEEWFWRPSAICSYSAGRFGGVRAAMQLRMTLGELGMSSIPSILPIPQVGKSLGSSGELLDPALENSTRRFLDELEWYARALKAERARGLPR